MRRYLLATVTALALAAPAKADAVNNLSLTTLGAGAVSQSQSNPCVICATQAQNPTGFGFNNFNSTGNDDSFNLFSSSVTGQFGNGVINPIDAYTAGFLKNFLLNLPLPDVTLTFGVAIDINTAGGANGNRETLTELRLIDLDAIGNGPLGSAVLFDLSGSYLLPNQNNGNGFADYLVTGFDLSAIPDGHRLFFQASWDHATDGGESFYLVPIITAAVPGPVVGAGFPGIVAGCIGLWGLAMKRRRRNQAHA
jgi:hypothetical protein